LTKIFSRHAAPGKNLGSDDIIDWLASGMTQDDILRDYAELGKEDIETALLFVSDRESKTKYLVS